MHFVAMLFVNNLAFSQVLAPQSTIYYEEKNSKLKKKDFSISRGQKNGGTRLLRYRRTHERVHTADMWKVTAMDCLGFDSAQSQHFASQSPVGLVLPPIIYPTEAASVCIYPKPAQAHKNLNSLAFYLNSLSCQCVGA